MTEQELREKLIELDGELWDYQLDKLVPFVTQYGDTREREGRIEENKRWLTVLAPAMDENVACNSDFHDRLAALKEEPGDEQTNDQL